MNKLFAGVLMGAASLTFATAAMAMTSQTRASYNANLDKATADYKMARGKCDALTGNEMSVCIEEAKAAQTKAVAQAKANKKVSDARVEARDDTREADYKVAAQKCDALAGVDKDSCVSAAKAKFNM
jgi:hypothetical protein